MEAIRNKLDDELFKIECEEAMQLCLKNLSDGKFVCDVEYPKFRDIKVKIIGLNLNNIYYRPVHVRILEKGLLKEETRWRDKEGYGMGMEPEQESYIEKVPLTDEWVNVEWLKNYRKD